MTGGGMAMKKITAYANAHQLQPLGQELAVIGVQEIAIMKYYSVSANVSRITLVCNDRMVDQVRTTIYQIVKTDSACDSCFFITDLGPLDSEPHLNAL
jgi:nitrogen regulatory protein PII